MTLAFTNPALNSALGTPPSSAGATFSRFEVLISMVIGMLTVVGGVYFIFQIITGAVQWISSGSDKDGVQRAQRKFTNAIIGLIILIFAYNLIDLVGKLLGYDIFFFTETLSGIIP